MITFIIKPVSVVCNLRCGYCYNGHLWSATAKNQKSKMPLSVLDNLIKQISELHVDSFSFIWHGGEPLMAGIKFYEAVKNFQAQYLKNSNYSNSVQTNGTMLDEEWADFFKKGDFRLGVSLDGPRNIHDKFRVFRNSKGSFDAVMRGIKIAHDAGLDVGAISVITKQSVPIAKDLLGFFNAVGLKKINFSACAEKNNSKITDFSLLPTDYAKFMIDIFDEWLAIDDPEIKIQPLESFFQGLIGGRPTICYCANECAAYLAIDANGNLYLCGRFMGIEKFRIGNIKEKTLKDLLCSPKFKTLSEETTCLKNECRNCQWQFVCKGGCSYYRYLNGDSLNSQNYFCSSTKRILKHMQSEIRKIDSSVLVA